MASFKNHPAYKRALQWARGSSPSYYFHVLRQNLHHFQEQVPSDPCEVDEQEVLRGTVFMVEEAIEYSSAKTLEKKFDALVDIVIVALGRAVFHGFHHFDEAMTRVIAANMQKVPGPSPRRGEWSRDLSKPEGWEPAYLSDLVQPSRIVDSATPSDEPLNEDETEILQDFIRRRLTEPHLEIADLVDERDCLIEVIKTHDQKEDLSAKVITNLRGKMVDLTLEGDKAAFDRDTLSERLSQVATERDEYQRQLRDEIGRCHALRGSNRNLHEKLVNAGVDEIGTASPIKFDQVHPVLLECAELLLRKSQDYGSSLTDFSKAKYMPFGHYSYVHMMHTKLSRIRAIAIDRDQGKDVNFESLRDSVLDLINYSAFYGAWLEELEKTDVEERAR